jgi:hypothetical protein
MATSRGDINNDASCMRCVENKRVKVRERGPAHGRVSATLKSSGGV